MLVNKNDLLFNQKENKYYKVMIADKDMFCAVPYEDNNSSWLDIKNVILMCNVENRTLNDYGFKKILHTPPHKLS